MQRPAAVKKPPAKPASHAGKPASQPKHTTAAPPSGLSQQQLRAAASKRMHAPAVQTLAAKHDFAAAADAALCVVPDTAERPAAGGRHSQALLNIEPKKLEFDDKVSCALLAFCGGATEMHSAVRPAEHHRDLPVREWCVVLVCWYLPCMCLGVFPRFEWYAGALHSHKHS